METCDDEVKYVHESHKDLQLDPKSFGQRMSLNTGISNADANSLSTSSC